jgi:membrane fusion protein, macrolide-specific efflux system
MGENALVTYVQDKRENALVLARSQVNLIGGQYYVYVLENGVRVERFVEVGLMTDTEVEIIKGLSAGDLIIIN